MNTNSKLIHSSDDLSEMVLVEPVSDGEGDTFPQVVHGLVSSDSNIPLSTVSHGHTGAEVVSLLSWDTNNDFMLVNH